MQEKQIKKSCAFTGHRPQRFSFGYNEDDEKCQKLNKIMEDEIEKLIAAGVTDYYTGMALGADTWAAEIILDLKEKYPALRLIAVLPCETQANDWTVEQRERYFNALAVCDEVITLHKKYKPSCMFERNRYLVDHAEYLLAVYDGGERSGTAYTVRYGKQKERKIIIIDSDTLAVKK
ncbi:MAG: DUF1273 domain-containing protein [Oscillospiraceae bacterium]|nr:DUF1273 domain-containing protein [Oscillospiraceae bacterium]